MQIETLKDILHWTKMFHEQLSLCLTHCSDANTSERARMVLDYLSDHEEKLMKVVNNFEVSGEEHALNTWSYEYVNKQPIVQHVHCDSPFAKLDTVQIMDVIVDRHAQIIELYRYLAAQALYRLLRKCLSHCFLWKSMKPCSWFMRPIALRTCKLSLFKS